VIAEASCNAMALSMCSTLTDYDEDLEIQMTDDGSRCCEDSC
jgi:hypothetical protein